MTGSRGVPRGEGDVLAMIVQAFAGGADPVVLMNGTRCEVTDGVTAQDDAAVIAVTGPAEILAASDYVRGPKFRLYELGLLDEYDLGWYLAAANLSDIAAMGAWPLGLLTVVRYPGDMPAEALNSVLRGIAECCAAAGTQTIGGDTGSAERLILSASALGAAAPGTALRRSGARPGDALFLTGPTGLAGAALAYFGARDASPSRARLGGDDEQRLLEAWRRPRARIPEGLTAAACGEVTSCIDTSDGLRGAIEGLATNSGVGFDIDKSALPVAAPVAEAARWLGCDAVDLVLSDSVDFQLAFTARDADAVRAAFAEQGLAEPFRIGSARDRADLRLVGRSGTGPLPGRAWKHDERAFGSR